MDTTEQPKPLSKYDEGYAAGWNFKHDISNPYLEEGLAISQDAQEWEHGRWDGRTNRSDHRP